MDWQHWFLYYTGAVVWWLALIFALMVAAVVVAALLEELWPKKAPAWLDPLAVAGWVLLSKKCVFSRDAQDNVVVTVKRSK